jgi:biotin-[acetyl-CoA-carboxylase] ligase BirA-like protein
MKKFDVADFNIVNFDEIDSTSTYLKSNYQSLKDFTICFANYQTLGRGRYQRKWMAPRGECLLFSLLMKQEQFLNKFDSLSLMSAFYLSKVIKKYVPNGEVTIKWPNDIYLNSKKIAGILLEGKSSNGKLDCLIIGVGININVIEFDQEIINKATSVFKETGLKQNIEDIKKDCLNGLKEMILAILNEDNSYLNGIREINFLKNKVVEANIDGEIKKVTVLDINDDNSLLVKLEEKTLSLSVGEVLPLNF